MKAADESRKALKCAIGVFWAGQKERRKQNGCIGWGGPEPRPAGRPHSRHPNQPCGGGQGSGISKQVSRGHVTAGASLWMWATHRPVRSWAPKGCARPAFWLAPLARLWGCAGAPHGR